MQPLRVFLLAAPLLFACAPGLEEERPVPLRLLQANVGNLRLDCREGYLYNLCEIAVEERIREGILALAPDVVALQEVVGPSQCEGFEEPDPSRTCHESHLEEEPLMARRLLGEGFFIACDTRGGFECVGVRETFGRIEGCDGEGLCEAETPEAPEGCDPGFTVSAVTVVPHDGEPFRLVNAHPQSGFQYACRREQLRQVFEKLAPDAPALLAGDFNVDPYVDTDEAVALWLETVGEGKRFSYHSGPAEKVPPYPTSESPLGTNVYDHVVSDFAKGTCTTLGEAPGTERLDGGEGCDHRALLCALELP